MPGNDRISERSELKFMPHKGAEVVSEDGRLQAAISSSKNLNAKHLMLWKTSSI